jgi:hypothetical protein
MSRLVYPKKNTIGPAVAIYPWETGRTVGPARFFVKARFCITKIRLYSNLQTACTFFREKGFDKDRSNFLG